MEKPQREQLFNWIIPRQTGFNQENAEKILRNFLHNTSGNRVFASYDIFPKSQLLNSYIPEK